MPVSTTCRESHEPLKALSFRRSRTAKLYCVFWGRNMYMRLIALAIGALTTGIALSQSIRTNADVVKLLQAGMSNSVILQAIDTAKDARFDTSADALILLKRRGATDEIIHKILSRGSVVSEPSQVSKASANALTEGGRCSDNDGDDGVLKVVDADREIRLTASQFNMDTSINPLSVLAMGITLGLVRTQAKVLVSLPGAKAVRRLEGNKPTLRGIGVLSNTAPESISLVRLDVKDGKREIVAGEGSFGVTGDSSSAGYPAASLVPLDFALIKKGCKYTAQGGQVFTLNVYDATPKSPLGVGEYALIVLGSREAFDFGVDR